MDKFKNYIIILLLPILFSSCKKVSKKLITKQKPLPNIVWIMLEDWGYQLSCYGEPGIDTPNVDQLAGEGIRYTNSFCTSPVCSPSRSAMMTGFHQSFIDSEQHRTDEKFGFPKKELPKGIKPITSYLKEMGYYNAIIGYTKTDLNFIHGDLFDSEDWADRKKDQPFFAQVTFVGTHRKWKRDSIRPISIDSVKVPPYYPQTDLVKRDWANGLEAMQVVDREVGELLKRLKDEGLEDNTIVFLIGDNGRCMPRGKQFLYDGGLQVPMIIRWPDKIAPNSSCTDLVSTLDITKTILDVINAKPEIPLQGKNLLDGSTAEREFVFAARDKMDSTYDASRAIRSKTFKLIQNLMPERPYLQYNEYKEDMYPTLAEMNVMYISGELNKDQSKFMLASKPEFELYDIVNDPYELTNLADDSNYQEIKNKYLKKLEGWRKQVKDKGVSEAFRNGGWSAHYPTRSLEEWKSWRKTFMPWVFRKPNSKIEHPRIGKH